MLPEDIKTKQGHSFQYRKIYSATDVHHGCPSLEFKGGAAENPVLSIYPLPLCLTAVEKFWTENFIFSQKRESKILVAILSSILLRLLGVDEFRLRRLITRAGSVVIRSLLFS
jgi:hypothetical protein